MIIFIAIIIVFIKISVWMLPFVRDGFGYAYVGSEIAKGAILYKDVWDHKPPGVYWLDAIIYRIFPSYIFGIRSVSILFGLLGAFLFYKLLRLFFSKKISLISTLLFSIFSNVYMLNQGDNMVETYMVPILIAVYYFFVRAVKTKKIRLFFLSGIFLGVLFIFKQVGILPLAAMTIFLFIKKEKLILRLFAILIGVASMVIPVVGYFVLKGASLDAFEAIFLYNFFYSGQGYTMSSIGQSMFYLLQVFLATFLFWFLGIAGIIKRKFTEIDLLFVFFFLFAFIGTAMGGKFAFSRNYFLLVIPSLGYFAAHGIEKINRLWQKDDFFKKVSLIGLFFLCLPSIILQFQAVLAGLYFQGMFKPDERETMYSLSLPNYNFVQDEKIYFNIALYLKTRVKDNQYILDFGAEPEMYLLTDTRSSSRFFYNFPINGVFINDNNQEERRKIFLKEISLRKPLYIVTNKEEERHKPSFKNLNFPDFKQFLYSNYILENTQDNYLVFKLKSP